MSGESLRSKDKLRLTKEQARAVHTYRKVVGGEVVRTAEVIPGHSHGAAWAEVTRP